MCVFDNSVIRVCCLKQLVLQLTDRIDRLWCCRQGRCCARDLCLCLDNLQG